MTKFMKGDRVGVSTRYGNGLEKKRFGEVIAVGAKGVQIRFDDDGEEWWRPAGVVLFEVDGKLVRERPAKPRALALVTDAPPVVVPPPVASAPVAAPVTHRDVLQHMEASGVDLLQLWRGIGESLRERQRAAVTAAGAAVKAAEQEVADAEALLSEARTRLADALRAQEAAANGLREVILQTGGGR